MNLSQYIHDLRDGSIFQHLDEVGVMLILLAVAIFAILWTAHAWQDRQNRESPEKRATRMSNDALRKGQNDVLWRRVVNVFQPALLWGGVGFFASLMLTEILRLLLMSQLHMSDILAASIAGPVRLVMCIGCLILGTYYEFKHNLTGGMCLAFAEGVFTVGFWMIHGQAVMAYWQLWYYQHETAVIAVSGVTLAVLFTIALVWRRDPSPRKQRTRQAPQRPMNADNVAREMRRMTQAEEEAEGWMR